MEQFSLLGCLLEMLGIGDTEKLIKSQIMEILSARSSLDSCMQDLISCHKLVNLLLTLSEYSQTHCTWYVSHMLKITT